MYHRSSDKMSLRFDLSRHLFIHNAIEYKFDKITEQYIKKIFEIVCI